MSIIIGDVDQFIGYYPIPLDPRFIHLSIYSLDSSFYPSNCLVDLK